MIAVHSNRYNDLSVHVCTRRCELWNHPPQMEEAELTKEQVGDLKLQLVLLLLLIMVQQVLYLSYQQQVVFLTSIHLRLLHRRGLLVGDTPAPLWPLTAKHSARHR
jgi:hypothetical protein